MVAVSVILVLMIVAAKTEPVGEVFKDMHSCATARAKDFGLFFGARRFFWDELVPAVRVLAAEFLKPALSVFTEFPDRAFTFRTGNIKGGV